MQPESQRVRLETCLKGVANLRDCLTALPLLGFQIQPVSACNLPILQSQTF